MNRFGQWCLVVLVGIWTVHLVVAPSETIAQGHGESCNGCKNIQNQKLYDLGFYLCDKDSTGNAQKPCAHEDKKEVDWSEPVTNDGLGHGLTRSELDADPDLKKAFATLKNAKSKESDRHDAKDKILDTINQSGGLYNNLCEAVFQMYPVCNINTTPCEVKLTNVKRKGLCGNRLSLNGILAGLAKAEQVEVINGKITVKCSMPDLNSFCTCLLNDLPTCANMQSPDSTECNLSRDPLVDGSVGGDGPPKDPNLDNLATDPSAPKE